MHAGTVCFVVLTWRQQPILLCYHGILCCISQ